MRRTMRTNEEFEKILKPLLKPWWGKTQGRRTNRLKVRNKNTQETHDLLNILPHSSIPVDLAKPFKIGKSPFFPLLSFPDPKAKSNKQMQMVIALVLPNEIAQTSQKWCVWGRQRQLPRHRANTSPLLGRTKNRDGKMINQWLRRWFAGLNVLFVEFLGISDWNGVVPCCHY